MEEDRRSRAYGECARMYRELVSALGLGNPTRLTPELHAMAIEAARNGRKDAGRADMYRRQLGGTNAALRRARQEIADMRDELASARRR
jgi:hypothetical protein